jgi:hypothetical protein
LKRDKEAGEGAKRVAGAEEGKAEAGEERRSWAKRRRRGWAQKREVELELLRCDRACRYQRSRNGCISLRRR